MRNPPLLLHIEELVLVGFPPAERYRIQDAVQAALAEMIAGGTLALPDGLRSRAIEATAPERFTLAGTPDAPGMGTHIARAIVSGVGASLAPTPKAAS